jgi:outer membrane protein, heavy metal efflux system
MFYPTKVGLCRITVLLVSLLLHPVLAEDQTLLTLDEVFRLAQSASPELGAANYRLEGARALEKGAGKLTNPQVRLSGTPVGQPENSANSIVQSLEIAGQRGLRRRAAQAQVSINSLLASRTLQQTLFDVGVLYYDYWQARQASLVTLEQVALSEALFQTAQKRYEVGEIAQAEVQRVELALAQANQAKASALASESIAQVQLNLRIGRPAEMPIELPGHSLPDLPKAPDHKPIELDLEDLLSRAELRPEYLIAQEQIRQARLGVDLASRAGYPDLELALLQPRLAQSGGSVQLSVVFPLFDWGGLGAQVAQKEQEVNALELDAQVQARTIQFEIREAWLRYLEAKKRRDISEIVALGYLTLADRARLGYEVGVLTLVEVLDQQSAYRQALLSWLSAEADFQKASLQLRRVSVLPMNVESEGIELL